MGESEREHRWRRKIKEEKGREEETKRREVSVRGMEAREPVHIKVISGFQALRQVRVPVVGLELATKEALQKSGRIDYSLSSSAR
ncbi:hypothetical protein PoB_005896500 [Plakobranchus ocellatus]|uniref:Uncharacterized protein n=1 Tax=Plakobranchus ocellatus TaxID=259542 RepID=A0AAV4CL85_9GAST|nr:hypothetical protein PoB_005896500 [Plakobranchus ocellatus]